LLVDQDRLQKRCAVVHAVRRVVRVRVVGVPGRLQEVVAGRDAGGLPDGSVRAGAGGVVAQGAAVAGGPIQPAAAGFAVGRLAVVQNDWPGDDDALRRLPDVVGLLYFENRVVAVELGKDVEGAAARDLQGGAVAGVAAGRLV